MENSQYEANIKKGAILVSVRYRTYRITGIKTRSPQLEAVLNDAENKNPAAAGFL